MSGGHPFSTDRSEAETGSPSKRLAAGVKRLRITNG